MEDNEILNLLPDDIKIIFDIGASIGQEIPNFRNKWPNSKIYAFEPDPRNLPELRSHTNINVFDIVLGSKNGTVDFYQSYPARESGSIRVPKIHKALYPTVKFTDAIKIPSMTLNTFCKDYLIPKIDFIWMDTQGAEKDIFEGAIEVLPTIKYIYTEAVDAELYEGAFNRTQIADFLSPWFDNMEIADNDNMLFKNRNA